MVDEDPPLVITVTQAVADAFAGLNEATRNAHNRAVKKAMATHTFNQIAGYHVLAGFKASIRAALMQKEGELNTLDAIKVAALKQELKE